MHMISELHFGLMSVNSKGHSKSVHVAALGIRHQLPSAVPGIGRVPFDWHATGGRTRVMMS